MKLMCEVYRCDEEGCRVTVISESKLYKCGACDRVFCRDHTADNLILIHRSNSERLIAALPVMCTACAGGVARIKARVLGNAIAKLTSDPENMIDEEKA